MKIVFHAYLREKVDRFTSSQGSLAHFTYQRVHFTSRDAEFLWYLSVCLLHTYTYSCNAVICSYFI